MATVIGSKLKIKKKLFKFFQQGYTALIHFQNTKGSQKSIGTRVSEMFLTLG